MMVVAGISAACTCGPGPCQEGQGASGSESREGHSVRQEAASRLLDAPTPASHRRCTFPQRSAYTTRQEGHGTKEHPELCAPAAHQGARRASVCCSVPRASSDPQHGKLGGGAPLESQSRREAVGHRAVHHWKGLVEVSHGKPGGSQLHAGTPPALQSNQISLFPKRPSPGVSYLVAEMHRPACSRPLFCLCMCGRLRVIH